MASEEAGIGRSVADLGAPIGAGRTAEIYAWEPGRALKLFRPEHAHDVEEEHAATRLAGERGAPAPEVFEIEEVEGRPGIVMERVDGESMMALMQRKPWRARGYSRQLAEMQWDLHQLPAEGLRDQKRELRHDIERGLALSEAERASVLDLLDRLPAGDRLCHWDFHPDNIIMTRRGPVIIDWVQAQVGNPVADFGRTTVLFAAATLPAHIHVWSRALLGRVRRYCMEAYAGRYRQLARPDAEERRAWRTVVCAARLYEVANPEHDRLLAFVREQPGTA